MRLGVVLLWLAIAGRPAAGQAVCEHKLDLFSQCPLLVQAVEAEKASLEELQISNMTLDGIDRVCSRRMAEVHAVCIKGRHRLKAGELQVEFTQALEQRRGKISAAIEQLAAPLSAAADAR